MRSQRARALLVHSSRCLFLRWYLAHAASRASFTEVKPAVAQGPVSRQAQPGSTAIYGYPLEILNFLSKGPIFPFFNEHCKFFERPRPLPLRAPGVACW